MSGRHLPDMPHGLCTAGKLVLFSPQRAYSTDQLGTAFATM